MILRAKYFAALMLVAGVIFPLASLAQLHFSDELAQTRLRLGERTYLTITIEGDNFVNNPVQVPDLMPYFQVTGQNGPSMSTQMSIINGKMSKRSTLVYQYELMAMKAGKVTIPKLTFRSGSKTYFTSPIQVEILEPQNAAQAAPSATKGWAPEADPFLKVELDKKEAYSGEQIVARWYLYFSRPLLNLKLTNLPALPDFKGMELEKAGQLSPVAKNFRGASWNEAFIQSMSLFPLRAGKATVGSLTMLYQAQSSQRDFFGMPVGQDESVVSEPVALNVLPLPEPAPDDFTGAVGKFEARSRLAKTQTRVNESNQLVVEVEGDGNPDYILEPKLVMPPEFEIYPPEVKVDTETRAGRLFTTKRFEYLVVAKKEGQLQVPAVSFRYFDPEAKEYKAAESPAIAVMVAPGAIGAPVAGGSVVQPGLPAVSEDIRFIKPDRQSLADESIGIFGKGWFWPAHLAGLLLVGAALYYRAFRERLDSDQVFARRLQAFGQSKKRLKKTRKLAEEGKTAEFISELKRALLEYFGDRFGISPWGLLEDDMREIMLKQGIPQELIQEFLSVFAWLSRAQFAGKMADSDGGKIVEQSEKIIAALEKEKR